MWVRFLFGSKHLRRSFCHCGATPSNTISGAVARLPPKVYYRKERESMLTAKQEKFVQCIIEGMSQADAYRSAYSTSNMSDNAIYREASVLMNNPNISQRLTELREKMMTPSIMTAQERLEYLTRVIKGEELEQTYDWEDGERVTCNTPASIKTRLQAVDLMNKMQGDYTTKVEASVTYEDNLRKLIGEDEY